MIIVNIFKWILTIVGMVGVLGIPGSVIYILFRFIKKKPVKAGFIFFVMSLALLILVFILYSLLFLVEHNLITDPNAII